MAVTTDVIFQLGVAGTKQVNADLAAAANGYRNLALAAVEVGRAVAKTIGDAEAFAEVLQNSSIDMTKMLNATKGMINTMTAYQGANKLTRAGVQATAEQMAALGKAAVKVSDQMGTTATEEFEKLTDAIMRGSSRGLIPYGIQLDETKDKSAAQAEALQKLVEKFQDVNVEIGNTTEGFEAMTNTLTTTRDLLVDAAWKNFVETFLPDAASGLLDINSTMMQLNNALIESDGILADWMTSWKGIGNTIAGVFVEAQRLMPWGWLAGKVAGKLGIDTSALNVFAENQYGAEQESKAAAKTKRDAEPAVMDFSLEEAGYGTEKKKRGGGGGGKRKPADDGVDMEFTLDETLAPEKERMERQARVDKMMADIEVQAQQELFDEWVGMQEARMITKADFDAQELAAEQAKYDALNAMQKQNYDNARAWAAMTTQAQIQQSAGALDTVGGFLAQAESMQDKSTKKGFEKSKNMQIAQIAMNTPSAAIGAYNSLAWIPMVGPVLGGIAAGIATAFGIAQMVKVKRTKFGGGNDMSAGAPPKTDINVSGGANNYGAGSTSGGGSTIVNNVILDGTVIHSSMIRANDGASQRGERSFTTAA